MLIRDVEVAGRTVDVRVADGLVADLGPNLARRDDLELAGAGGALIPGLHDHHLHLLAAAAAGRSVDVGPPAVRDPAGFVAALRAAVASDGAIRAVNYHESVAGPLDRDRLDAARADVAVRVQHRSGALWVLNSPALARLGLAEIAADAPDGVERDAAGRPTGRLWRVDGWLAERTPTTGEPDLRGIAASLAATGVTGVTDATPTMSDSSSAALRAAVARGDLPQRLTVLAADAAAHPAWDVGPAKIVVADHDAFDVDGLRAQVRSARAAGRAVAVHCVSRAALVLAIVALEDVGPRHGDRIEHAAVAPPELAHRLAGLNVAVVTQPSLPARRGDDYLDGVAADDRGALWPFASLLAAGVGVGCSSDAPYGDLDPWAGVRAATTRRTPSGRDIGAGERVAPDVALRAYLTAPSDPGGAARVVAPGVPADLVLLDAPMRAVLGDPDARHVRATLIAGRVVHGASALR